MPNGQEVGKENVAALEAWAATQSDEDFTQIIYQASRSITRGRRKSSILSCARATCKMRDGIGLGLRVD